MKVFLFWRYPVGGLLFAGAGGLNYPCDVRWISDPVSILLQGFRRIIAVFNLASFAKCKPFALKLCASIFVRDGFRWYEFMPVESANETNPLGKIGMGAKQTALSIVRAFAHRARPSSRISLAHNYGGVRSARAKGTCS